MRRLGGRTTYAFILILLLGLLLTGGCAQRDNRFEEGTVDLTPWQPVLYNYPENGQGFAKWVLGKDKQSVTQIVNADPSIFISDRELMNTSISGTWSVGADRGDDDLMGFVFAYQDPGHFYLFDWKCNAQTDSGVGRAERGMCVKRVGAPYEGPATGELPPGKPFDGHDLWDTQGVEGKVKLLHHEETVGWETGTPYRFQLDFRPGSFRIVVKNGERVLFDQTLQDETYKSGRFGFYNFSQDGVTYKEFVTRHLKTELNIWIILFVVITILAHLLMLFLFLLAWKRRRKAKKAEPTEPVTGEQKE